MLILQCSSNSFGMYKKYACVVLCGWVIKEELLVLTTNRIPEKRVRLIWYFRTIMSLLSLFGFFKTAE